MNRNLWYRIVAGSLLKKLEEADARIHTLLNTVHAHKVRITELEEAAKKSKSDADIAVRVIRERMQNGESVLTDSVMSARHNASQIRIRDLEAENERLRAAKAELYPELDRLRAKLAKFNQR